MRTLALVTVVLVIIALAIHIGLKAADGPVGPLAGGKLATGDWHNDPLVDWLAVTDRRIETQETPYFVELELEATGRSRTTGILYLDGEAYIPCDLGFGWQRFDDFRYYILRAIYHVKTWHNQAEQNGQVVLRMAGKRFAREAVRVNDPNTIERLKVLLEAHSGRWSAPQTFGERPTAAPNDIWFFRLDPRVAGLDYS